MIAAFRIRPTSLDDVDAVIALVKASWARTYDPVIGENARRAISDAKHTRQLFEREIGTADGVSFVATDRKDTILGHLGGLLKSDGTCFIDRVHVVPDWQGRGVAMALVDRVVETLRGRATALELTVLENNARAVAFYRKAEFQVVSGAAEGLAHVPAVLMCLSLHEKP